VRVAAGLEWSVNVDVIEMARVLRGWTRRELAHEARVDEGTLCDLVGRRRRPTFGTLRAVCQALNLEFGSTVAFGRPAERCWRTESPNLGSGRARGE
jgi:transcriptional regulator with XRE-family HTH domain